MDWEDWAVKIFGAILCVPVIAFLLWWNWALTSQWVSWVAWLASSVWGWFQ
jgi:hypothetical protein